MREAGYWTIGVTSNQFLYEPSGYGRGFDDWVEVDKRPPVPGPESWKSLKNPKTSRYWRTVNENVGRALERRPGNRFFLYVHYIDVHDYRLQKMGYADSVVMTDRAVGELMEQLEAEGLLADSVVIFTSDHGERLGEEHGLPDELPGVFGHYGNPSFQEVLEVPLIVAPPVFEDTSRFVRTQDLFGLVLRAAGLAEPPSEDTTPDELFVGERFYRTYRQGRWKSSVRRSDGRAVLYDLDADPDERNDVSSKNPLRLLAHRNRINELTSALHGRAEPERELSEEEKERLRILGYLEE
jgi:arylsulfatase A-like enzyme